jgi:hypothetical protein
VVSYHRTRRSRSALAYGSRSTTAAETTSTRSYTTNGDATRMRVFGKVTNPSRSEVASHLMFVVAALSPPAASFLALTMCGCGLESGRRHLA